jgi:hypothetical protein
MLNRYVRSFVAGFVVLLASAFGAAPSQAAIITWQFDGVMDFAFFSGGAFAGMNNTTTFSLFFTYDDTHPAAFQDGTNGIWRGRASHTLELMGESITIDPVPTTSG